MHNVQIQFLSIPGIPGKPLESLSSGLLLLLILSEAFKYIYISGPNLKTVFITVQLAEYTVA